MDIKKLGLVSKSIHSIVLVFFLFYGNSIKAASSSTKSSLSLTRGVTTFATLPNPDPKIGVMRAIISLDSKLFFPDTKVYARSFCALATSDPDIVDLKNHTLRNVGRHTTLMTQLEIGRTFNVIFDTNYFFNEIGLDARLGLHTLLGLNPLLEGGTSWHTSLSPYVNITPRTFLAFPMTLSLTSTSAGIAFGFDIVDDTISVELMGECTDIHHIFAYKLQTSLKYKF